MKIKVILIQDVKKIGEKHNVVEVSSGLAYNQLIPTKKAILATPANLRKFDAIKKADARKEEEKKQESVQLKKVIEGTEFLFELETHKGKMVGTITSAALAEQINRRCSANIDKRKIKLEHISKIGSYIAIVHLFHDVNANARVVVKEKK